MASQEKSKFKIITIGGDIIESHDENWEQVKDHAHALLPHNNSPWFEYQIHTENGYFIAVNFKTGAFNINGQPIFPALEDGIILSGEENPQNFDEVSEPWRFLNGLNYFPVVGRRHMKGERIDMVIPYCGWKIKHGNRTIMKVAYLYPDHHVVFT